MGGLWALEFLGLEFSRVSGFGILEFWYFGVLGFGCWSLGFSGFGVWVLGVWALEFFRVQGLGV